MPEPSTTTVRSETSFFERFSAFCVPRRLADGEPDHRVLLVAVGDLLDGSVLERALDELVEPVPVALLERRSLRLPVVGEHDDLVGAGRVATRTVDAAELLVELAQRLQGVCALEPRVVRDLVVAREGGVDGGTAAHHVREDAVDDQVADDHAHRAAEEGVDAAAVAPRLHVATDRSERRRPLEQDLECEQDERPCDVESVRKEGAVAGIRPLLGLHAADGQDHLLGLAREQVAAARAAVDQEADARGPLPLDACAVVRRRAGRQHPALLVHPAERRDVLVRAEQDPRLARPGLRGQVGLPLGQPVRAFRDPAGHVGRVPVPHRPPEDGERESVDLEEDDPGLVRAGATALSAGDALDDSQRVGVVVVRPEDHLEDDAHGCDQERRQQGPAEVVHHEGVFEQIGGELQHEGVDRQHEQEAEREHERQPQRRDQRREQRVQHGDDGGDAERAGGSLDVDSGQDRRRHPQRRGGQDPRQQ